MESESVVLAVTRFRRSRSRSGVVRGDSMIGRFTTRNAPFVTGGPPQLHLEGFIQKNEDRYRFFAPDAGLVLSSEFLEVIGHNAPVVPKLDEFERRRKFGIGTFLTRANLAMWESAPLPGSRPASSARGARPRSTSTASDSTTVMANLRTSMTS